jgi:hypothetical protein
VLILWNSYFGGEGGSEAWKDRFVLSPRKDYGQNKLNFGRSDTPLLRKLREVLRESRLVAARERQKVRVRLS